MENHKHQGRKSLSQKQMALELEAIVTKWIIPGSAQSVLRALLDAAVAVAIENNTASMTASPLLPFLDALNEVKQHADMHWFDDGANEF